VDESGMMVIVVEWGKKLEAKLVETLVPSGPVTGSKYWPMRIPSAGKKRVVRCLLSLGDGLVHEVERKY